VLGERWSGKQLGAAGGGEIIGCEGGNFDQEEQETSTNNGRGDGKGLKYGETRHSTDRERKKEKGSTKKSPEYPKLSIAGFVSLRDGRPGGDWNGGVRGGTKEKGANRRTFSVKEKNQKKKKNETRSTFWFKAEDQTKLVAANTNPNHQEERRIPKQPRKGPHFLYTDGGGLSFGENKNMGGGVYLQKSGCLFKGKRSTQ